MNKLFKVLILLFVFLFINNAYAYTKEDIVSLGKTVKTCENSTKKEVDDLIVSYTKLINERNITDSNLDIIYNNLKLVIDILNENNVCSEKDLSSLPEEIKTKLKKLYSDTNKIIKSSPRIVDNKIEDINIVINEDKNIEIYSGDVLKDVINRNNELNYVGLNRTVVISLIIFLIIFIASLIKICIKKDIFTISILYVSIFFLIFIFAFKDKLSIVLDFIPTTKKEKVVDLIVKDKEILSYPSYGNAYGKIKINDEEDNLFYGDSKYILTNGVGTSTNNSLPGIGKTILSSHNIGIFKNLFNNHKSIEINTSYGKFTYEIKDKEIVDKNDLDSLNKDYDLIMYTCYPKVNIYGNKRLIVYASLVNIDWESK